MVTMPWATEFRLASVPFAPTTGGEDHHGDAGEAAFTDPSPGSRVGHERSRASQSCEVRRESVARGLINECHFAA